MGRRTPWSEKTLHQEIILRSLNMWVVVEIMVPFGVPIIIRHLLFRVLKMGP